MSKCNKCSTNIDVFPLLKSCESTGSGGTGPTGPRGARGPAGSGTSASNYISLFGTTVSNTLAPLTLTNNVDAVIPFFATYTNNGWSFTQGQSSFIVPEDGTYRISFNPNLKINITVNEAQFGGCEFQFKEKISIDGNELSRAAVYGDFYSSPQANSTREQHIELLADLTAGQIIQFIVNIIIIKEYQLTVTSMECSLTTFANIERIA